MNIPHNIDQENHFVLTPEDLESFISDAHFRDTANWSKAEVIIMGSSIGVVMFDASKPKISMPHKLPVACGALKLSNAALFKEVIITSTNGSSYTVRKSELSTDDFSTVMSFIMRHCISSC